MKMKLYLGIAIAALAMSIGAAKAGPLADRVAAGEPIRLGFAAAAPWAHPGENGEPLGFVNVIAIDVLKKMGSTNIEPVVTDWSGLIPSLMAGRVDIITGGMAILGERCKNIDFSAPIGQFGSAFIVPEGNPQNIQSYQDVKNAGVVMAAVSGYVNVEHAKKEGIADENVMQLPGITEVLAAVKSGRAAAGIMTDVEAIDLANKTEGIDATDPKALPLYTFNWIGIGFPSDDDEFREKFNAAMVGYIGSDEMLAAVAPYNYQPSNLPDDTTTQWACENR